MVGGLEGYPARLAEAMGASPGQPPSKAEINELASHLDVTYTAVAKFFRGGSSSMSAENNSRTARKYSVSPDWLATGEGSKQLIHPRPEELPILEDIRLLERLEPELLKKFLDLLHTHAENHRHAEAVIPTKNKRRHSASKIPAISSEASQPSADFGGGMSGFGELADAAPPPPNGRRK